MTLVDIAPPPNSSGMRPPHGRAPRSKRKPESRRPARARRWPRRAAVSR